MKGQLEANGSRATGPPTHSEKPSLNALTAPGAGGQQHGGHSYAVLSGHFRSDWREFLSGWGAASINVSLTFPLNKVMFRQQLYGITTKEAVQQLRKEGVTHLYRGVLPPFLQKTTSLAIMFGMYDEFKKAIHRHAPHLPTAVNQGAAAVLAGCTEAVLLPFERIQTLLQDKFYHKHYRNTIHAFGELRHHGPAEYYRGLTAVLLRNGPSNAMFFLFRGEIKKYLPQSGTRQGEMARNFVSGGVLGACISTVYFPVNVVKTRMQSQVGGPFPGFWTSLGLVLEERNGSVRELFRGVSINFTRSLISWGIINAAYEILLSYL